MKTKFSLLLGLCLLATIGNGFPLKKETPKPPSPHSNRPEPLKMLNKGGNRGVFRYIFRFEDEGNKYEIEALQQDRVIATEPKTGKIFINSDQLVMPKIADAQGKYNEIPGLRYQNRMNCWLYPNGQLEDIKIATFPPIVCLFMNTLTPKFHPRGAAVRVGTEWHVNTAPVQNYGYPGGATKFKLIAFEDSQIQQPQNNGTVRVLTFPTAKLEWSHKENSKDGSSAEGYMWVNTADGTLVKLEGKLHNTLFFPTRPPMKEATVTVTRLE